MTSAPRAPWPHYASDQSSYAPTESVISTQAGPSANVAAAAAAAATATAAATASCSIHVETSSAERAGARLVEDTGTLPAERIGALSTEAGEGLPAGDTGSPSLTVMQGDLAGELCNSADSSLTEMCSLFWL